MSLQLAAATSDPSYNAGRVIGAVLLVVILGYFLRSKVRKPASRNGRVVRSVAISAVLVAVVVVAFESSKPSHHGAQAATPTGPVVHISMPAPVGSDQAVAAYVKRANSTCAAEDSAFRVLGDGPGDKTASTPAELRASGKYITGVATVFARELQALRALPQPKHVSHYVNDTYRSLSKVVTSMRLAAKSANAGDAARFNQAVAAVTQYGDAFHTAATAAGLTVCG